MEPVFVKACFNLDCDWEGLPPVYRIYVNDDIFTERSFIWSDCFVEENLQILAPPGRYSVRVEPVGPQISKFTTDGHRIDYGPGKWIDPGTLEIAA